MGFGIKMLSKGNIRIILLLLGILFTALFIHTRLLEVETFENNDHKPPVTETVNNPSPNVINQPLDETQKKAIMQEIKTNATNMVQGNLDYLLPCLLKMNSCKNSLAMSPIQSSSISPQKNTVKNVIMPSNNEDNEPVPNVPPITTNKNITQSPAVNILPNGNPTIEPNNEITDSTTNT